MLLTNRQSTSTVKTMVPIAPLVPTDEPAPSILETTAPLSPTDEPGVSTLETTAQLAPIARTDVPGAYIVLLFCVLLYINCN